MTAGFANHWQSAAMAFLLNILWFVLGGLVMGLGWWLAGVVCAITIVGIPWARSCFVIGKFSFWPFGQEAVSRQELTGISDFGTGPFGFLGNVIWFLLAGWWLAINASLMCWIPKGMPTIVMAHTTPANHQPRPITRPPSTNQRMLSSRVMAADFQSLANPAVMAPGPQRRSAG